MGEFLDHLDPYAQQMLRIRELVKDEKTHFNVRVMIYKYKMN